MRSFQRKRQWFWAPPEDPVETLEMEVDREQPSMLVARLERPPEEKPETPMSDEDGLFLLTAGNTDGEDA